MTRKLDPVLARLSPEERIRYVQDLWDQIAEHSQDMEITEAQRDELDERLARHSASKEASVPWAEVRSRLAAKT